MSTTPGWAERGNMAQGKPKATSSFSNGRILALTTISGLVVSVATLGNQGTGLGLNALTRIWYWAALSR
jgi:hypothetical protein